MKTFMSYRSAVKGLAALALVFTAAACGGSKGGGGGTVATPAGSSGDCSTTTSKCTVGSKYNSGTFLGAGYGEGYYDYSQYVNLYLGFFAKSKVTVNKQYGYTYVDYNGDVLANGTLKITDEYAKVINKTASREVAGVGFYFDFSLGGNGGYDYGYTDPGYYVDYGNYNNGGYYGGNNGGCGSCGYGNGGYTNGGYNNGDTTCQLPKGTYKVATTTAGTWYSYGSGGQVGNLKVKLTGPRTIVATFNGFVSSTGDTSAGQLQGQLYIQTVNGHTCNSAISF